MREMPKILVIDNEASSRDYLRLHLETAGHQVFAAEDAIAGLRLAVSIRPDLILVGGGQAGHGQRQAPVRAAQ